MTLLQYFLIPEIMNMDPKLVASTQEYEVEHIAQKFSISIDTVREIMLQVGKGGKPCRSRKVIYKAIREMQEVPKCG